MTGAPTRAIEQCRVEPDVLTGIRILVVDDDPDMCNALEYLLGSYGAEVSAATSAAEALTAFESSRPDVLLSDVAMDGESGFDLMRKVIAREGRDAPPAAAISAYFSGKDHAQALAAGFRALLPKPIEPGTLVALVADLAGRTLASSRAWR
jgi:CheY-like chemotaxis protein